MLNTIFCAIPLRLDILFSIRYRISWNCRKTEHEKTLKQNCDSRRVIIINVSKTIVKVAATDSTLHHSLDLEWKFKMKESYRIKKLKVSCLNKWEENCFPHATTAPVMQVSWILDWPCRRLNMIIIIINWISFTAPCAQFKLKSRAL